MLKHIRHIILIAALLLAFAGNVARLGVCPCSEGFLGLFVGDCPCNTCSAVSPECHGCQHASPCLSSIHGAVDAANTKGHHAIGETPCPNKMLEGSGPLLQVSEISIPTFLLTPVIVPEWQNWSSIILFPSQEFVFEIPLPPLIEQGISPYTGYSRPVLA